MIRRREVTVNTDLSSVPGSSMLEYFSALDDPRVAWAQRHSLLAIVTIALCGVTCSNFTELALTAWSHWHDVTKVPATKKCWRR